MNIDTINRSLPFCLGAEGPVNNHYLFNSLPSLLENVRMKHGGEEIITLGFSLKTSRMEHKETNSKRT